MQEVMVSDSVKKVGLMEWNLDEEGCLRVGGAERIPDYSCGSYPAPPWQEVRESIRAVIIGEGVTQIGLHAFEGCGRLSRVQLPSSLTRIHAYAFKDCASLKELEAGGRSFRYIYDNSAPPVKARLKKDEDSEVIFGVGTFSGTPWGREAYPEGYRQEDRLLIWFGSRREIVIPEGVTALGKFAFMDVEADSLILPKSLSQIEDLAFSGSRIRSIRFSRDATPASMGNFAFAGAKTEEVIFPARQVQVPFFAADPVMHWGETAHRRELPDGTAVKEWVRKKGKHDYLTERYRVTAASPREGESFRRLLVSRKKPVYHKDGTVTGFYGRDRIDVGKSLYRRLVMGLCLIVVYCENGRVVYVRSLLWHDYEEAAEEYIMFPARSEDDMFYWKDDFGWRGRYEIENGFDSTDGEKLMAEGTLRILPKGTHEEWFVSPELDAFGGRLESEVAQAFLKNNPDIRWI